jgi:hypothetical protein
MFIISYSHSSAFDDVENLPKENHKYDHFDHAFHPNSLKLIAQGYRKITSTHKIIQTSNQKVFYREWNTRFLSLLPTFKVFIFYF